MIESHTRGAIALKSKPIGFDEWAAIPVCLNRNEIK